VFALVYLATGNGTASVVIATIVGATFNYFSYGKLVFNNVGYGALARFVVAYAVIGVANIVLLDALRMLISQPLLSQLVLLPVLVAAAFVLNKYWVFRR
jgi:putative flippase GtrA